MKLERFSGNTGIPIALILSSYGYMFFAEWVFNKLLTISVHSVIPSSVAHSVLLVMYVLFAVISILLILNKDVYAEKIERFFCQPAVTKQSVIKDCVPTILFLLAVCTVYFLFNSLSNILFELCNLEIISTGIFAWSLVFLFGVFLFVGFLLVVCVSAYSTYTEL